MLQYEREFGTQHEVVDMAMLQQTPPSPHTQQGHGSAAQHRQLAAQVATAAQQTPSAVTVDLPARSRSPRRSRRSTTTRFSEQIATLEKKIDSLTCLFLNYQQHPQVGQSSRHTQTVGASPTGDYNAGAQGPKIRGWM
jgi:hypothetical protein